VVVEFRDKDSGHVIRIAADATGKPLADEKGMVSLGTDGTGPPPQFDFFGTGFLVASDGRLLTNHHVAEPWWSDEKLKELLDRGAEGFAASYTAYSPGFLKAWRPSSTGFRGVPIWQLSSYRLQHRLRPHSWNSMIGAKPV
jgi:hypothetical protein